MHLHLSARALHTTPPERAWTLPAYRRYAQEVDPEAVAEVVLRVDHPDRPALLAR
ncbi:MAG: hypothetical protein M3408_01355 [Actinomycetota bacterium]|jgi:hypothetical protein|nr:hypothetical protein [Actinomycetota bacterium]